MLRTGPATPERKTGCPNLPSGVAKTVSTQAGRAKNARPPTIRNAAEPCRVIAPATLHQRSRPRPHDPRPFNQTKQVGTASSTITGPTARHRHERTDPGQPFGMLQTRNVVEAATLIGHKHRATVETQARRMTRERHIKTVETLFALIAQAIRPTIRLNSCRTSHSQHPRDESRAAGQNAKAPTAERGQGPLALGLWSLRSRRPGTIPQNRAPSAGRGASPPHGRTSRPPPTTRGALPPHRHQGGRVLASLRAAPTPLTPPPPCFASRSGDRRRAYPLDH